MVEAGTVIGVTRTVPANVSPPRGWYLAAAGRAMAVEPELIVEWV